MKIKYVYKGDIFLLSHPTQCGQQVELYMLIKGEAFEICQLTGDLAGKIVGTITDNIVGQSGIKIPIRQFIDTITSLFPKMDIHSLKIINSDQLKDDFLSSNIFNLIVKNQQIAEGAIFELEDTWEDDITYHEFYIVAQNSCAQDRELYPYQLFQITGYHAGWCPGYIKKDLCDNNNLTTDSLWAALKFNFSDPHLDSLRIIPRLRIEEILISA